MLVQTAEDDRMRWKWVDYSAFDSKATWDLYHSLREKLQSTACTIDMALQQGMCGSLQSYSQWDLYLDLLRPFGEALTAMEQARFRPCLVLPTRRSTVHATGDGSPSAQPLVRLCVDSNHVRLFHGSGCSRNWWLGAGRVLRGQAAPGGAGPEGTGRSA